MVQATITVWDTDGKIVGAIHNGDGHFSAAEQDRITQLVDSVRDNAREAMGLDRIAV